MSNTQPKQKGHDNPPRVKVFGTISACALIRWMAKDGFSVDECGIAITTLGGHKIKDTTIEAAHYDGRKGIGKVPTLTTHQKKVVREARF